MSSYEVGKLFRDIFVDKEVRKEFAGSPETVLSRYDLTGSERDMISSRNYLALYESSIHPVLLFHFAQTVGVRDEFMKEVVPKLSGVRNDYYDYYSRLQ